jgi:F-type H+-transporting ATPase subunit b
MNGLQRRELAISGRIEEAERYAKQAEAQLDAYRQKMAAAAEEAQEILARARRDAEQAAARIRTEAQQAASDERARAIADIQMAKTAALREVAERGADVAVLLAGRIVRRELNTTDHASLVSEALDQFPSNN